MSTDTTLPLGRPASGDLAAAIAVTRFGLGARPGEIGAARADPRAFLLNQITPRGADQPAGPHPTAAEGLALYKARHADRRADRQAGDARSPATRAAALAMHQGENEALLGRLQLGATTPAGFRERWALFWLNHFTVSADKKKAAPLVGPFETEAIRPHVFGRFEDLLAASSRHPAMLIYLDQNRSIGPDSPAARASQGNDKKSTGLNENLAREILELHTVGLEGGYSQADVTEFARALTGWRVADGEAARAGGDVGAFRFAPAAHEPGDRVILGRRYREGGEAQARAVLTDLAADPHTAHHLAVKLARHFVADDPPPSLVARLRTSWTDSGGDLAAVARTLVEAPEAWDPAPRKIKSPYEFVVSSWRAAGATPTDGAAIATALTDMGQKPFSPPSPKGWSDEGETWAAPDALVKRMTWSEAFAAQSTAGRDPTVLADAALGARLTTLTARTVARAETRPEGFSILLMSPEFQRR